jgi:hypothetical protein
MQVYKPASARCQAAGPMVPEGGCPNAPTQRLFFYSREGAGDTADLCLKCALRLEQEAQAHQAPLRRQALP